jgi:hypothetical protein
LASRPEPLILGPPGSEDDHYYVVYAPLEIPIHISGAEPLVIETTAALPEGITFDDARRVLTGIPRVAGEYSIAITATNAFGRDTKRLDIAIYNGLEGALESPEGVYFGSYANWSAEPWNFSTTVFRSGLASARSGFTPDGNGSGLYTWVDGPLRIDFWWRASSEAAHDWGVVSLDGVVMKRISGETEWQRVEFEIPPGNHGVTWTYAKDAKASAGEDAIWLDQVSIKSPPFAAWMQAFRRPGQALSESDLLPCADPDGDGSANLIEYASGTDPFDGIPPYPVCNSVSIPDPKSYSTFAYLLNPFVHGLKVSPEWSPDMAEGSWRRDWLVPLRTCQYAIGSQRVFLVDPPAGDTRRKGFWRLRVEMVEQAGGE